VRKHVIIEGMDGSGKDTLISTLMKLTRGEFRIHDRASTSLGGPVQNVADWVIRDLAEMPTNRPMFYNRHPLISEPIYAPRRGINPGLRGKWRVADWIHTHRLIAAQHCVLVICHPPFHVIHMNLSQSRDKHMPGVVAHAGDLYAAYQQIAYPVWPGPMLRYDYRHDSAVNFLEALRRQLEREV
jgi:hypothetical protein